MLDEDFSWHLFYLANTVEPVPFLCYNSYIRKNAAEVFP